MLLPLYSEWNELVRGDCLSSEGLTARRRAGTRDYHTGPDPGGKESAGEPRRGERDEAHAGRLGASAPDCPHLRVPLLARTARSAESRHPGPPPRPGRGGRPSPQKIITAGEPTGGGTHGPRENKQ